MIRKIFNWWHKRKTQNEMDIIQSKFRCKAIYSKNVFAWAFYITAQELCNDFRCGMGRGSWDYYPEAKDGENLVFNKAIIRGREVKFTGEFRRKYMQIYYDYAFLDGKGSEFPCNTNLCPCCDTYLAMTDKGIKLSIRRRKENSLQK